MSYNFPGHKCPCQRFGYLSSAVAPYYDSLLMTHFRQVRRDVLNGQKLQIKSRKPKCPISTCGAEFTLKQHAKSSFIIFEFSQFDILRK